MSDKNLSPGDSCVIIDIGQLYFRGHIGKTVVLIGLAPTCSDGTCETLLAKHWCPHWIVSGLPSRHYPSHEILQKIPFEPMIDEILEEEPLHV